MALRVPAGGSGTASHCDVCFKCDGTTCVKDPGQAKDATPQQVPGNCKTETCDGVGIDAPEDTAQIVGNCKKEKCGGAREVDEADKPELDIIRYDCKKPGCSGESPILDKEIEDKDIRPEDAECKECKGGKLENKPDTEIPDAPLASLGPLPEPVESLLGDFGQNKRPGTYRFGLSCLKIGGFNEAVNHSV